MTVSTIRLGKVVDVSAGQPAPKPNDFSDSGFPFIRAGSLERLLSGQTEDDCEKIDAETARRYRMRLYPKDTILFAKSGMSAKIGRVYRMRQPAYVVSHLAALAPVGKYEPSYLAHWLRAHPPSKLIKDEAYPSIRTSEVSSLEIPNLHIDEQRRIAEILDKADNIRRKRELALALADDFLRSAFLAMFGDPNTNSKGWRVGKIRECLSDVVAGWSAVGEPRPANEGEFGVLKISAVTTGEYLPKENKAVTSLDIKKSIIVPKEGDLLFSRANTRELVAATCLVADAQPNVFLPDKLWRLDPDPQVADVTYLKFVLSNPDYRSRLCAQATGTSGSMLNISKAKLLDHDIPIPPLGLQITFAKLWREGRKMRTSNSSQLAEATELFASLSQRAFRGEL